MALYCIVSEIERDIGRKMPIFKYPFLLIDHLKPLEFLSKILTQTVRVPKLS